MRRWTLAVAAAAAFFIGSSALAQEAADEGSDTWAPFPGASNATEPDLLEAKIPPTAEEELGNDWSSLPEPYEVEPDPFDVRVPPTAEEELRNASSPTFDIAGDLRLEGMRLDTGGAMGIRVLVEGKHFGFDGGFSGVFVRVPGDASLVANGLLDLQLTLAPLSGQRGRIRLEAGLGALFTPWVRAVGPDLGASGEVRLVGPLGVAGAVRAVLWPYRSLDWNAAIQLTFGETQLRFGVREVSVEVEGLAGGQKMSFMGPWIGAGLRL
ncbi:MAG TPA: hypothetical protein VGK67_33340 [Myxococcales bacterium]|jgi:hypothetical protein